MLPQKAQIPGIPPQATDMTEISNNSPPSLYKVHKLVQRTRTAGARIAVWQLHDPIVDVDTDKDLVRVCVGI